MRRKRRWRRGGGCETPSGMSRRAALALLVGLLGSSCGGPHDAIGGPGDQPFGAEGGVDAGGGDAPSTPPPPPGPDAAGAFTCAAPADLAPTARIVRFDMVGYVPEGAKWAVVLGP